MNNKQKYFNLSAEEKTTTRVVENYIVDWANLVFDIEKLEIEDYQYLSMIEKYTNTVLSESPTLGGGGIFAFRCSYRQDAEFERLISHLELPEGYFEYLNETLIPGFIANVLTETNLYDMLSVFSTDKESLRAQIIKAVDGSKYDTGHSNFLIGSALSEYLYSYGIYDHFYKSHTKGEAVEITSDFTNRIFQNSYDNLYDYNFYGAWNNWFDPNGCNNRTFLFFNKKLREIWLLCFSHSD